MKPFIRVFDLETTGFTPETAGVCEVARVDVEANGADLVCQPIDWEVVHNIWSLFVHPGHPIPPETSAIHHIVDEDVAAARPWAEEAPRLFYNGPVALAAHNAKFERQWITDDLSGGLPWVCTYKCALRLWPDAPGHSNQTLRYWLKPEGLSREMSRFAHRAGPDAYVTAFLLREQLRLANLEQLVAWSSEPALQVRCRIGKQRGMLWREVDDGFLRWVADRDFDEDVIFTVRTEMARREAEAQADDDSAGMASPW